jgi:hypothetical protein
MTAAIGLPVLALIYYVHRFAEGGLRSMEPKEAAAS